MPQETRLSYRGFTQKEINSLVEHGVLNGHGPADSPFLVALLTITQPSWLHNASAYQHDFYYIRGGTETDRWEADFSYYLIMLQDANRGQPNDFIYFFRWLRCWIHFKAVRYGGRKGNRFHYGTSRTKEEIMALSY